MNIIVFSHIGLGDQFVMNAYINYLFLNNIPELVYLVAQKSHQNTLEHMYEKYIKSNNLKLYLFDKGEDVLFLDKKEFNSIVNLDNKEFRIHSFGIASNKCFYSQTIFWADLFYVQAGLTPNIRFDYFRFPDNLSVSEQNYKSLMNFINNQDYIVVHDDPSRNHYINPNKLINILQFNETINLPVIYIGLKRYSYKLVDGLNNPILDNSIFNTDSCLNLYHIIANCREGHFMDSSLISIANNIYNTKGKYYCHNYIRNSDTFKLLNPKINWSFIE